MIFSLRMRQQTLSPDAQPYNRVTERCDTRAGSLSCGPAGPGCPPPPARLSCPPWRPWGLQNSQKPLSRLWSAWTGGQDTGCCQKACDGRTGRGSSGSPSGRHCRGSSDTGKAGDLRAERVASQYCSLPLGGPHRRRTLTGIPGMVHGTLAARFAKGRHAADTSVWTNSMLAG